MTTTKGLTRRCSEPRASLRLTFCVFAIDASAAWHVASGSRSLILCLVRPQRMRAHGYVAITAVAAALSSTVVAAPPAAVRNELSEVSRPQAVARRVQDLPKPLRRALARAFEQRSLHFGDAGAPLGSSFTYTGDPLASAPRRRLCFAFDTPSYHVVYYQAGHPEGATKVLVFARTRSGIPKLIWGGVEFGGPHADSPRQLQRRILRGKFMDDLPYIW